MSEFNFKVGDKVFRNERSYSDGTYVKITAIGNFLFLGNPTWVIDEEHAEGLERYYLKFNNWFPFEEKK